MRPGSEINARPKRMRGSGWHLAFSVFQRAQYGFIKEYTLNNVDIDLDVDMDIWLS